MHDFIGNGILWGIIAVAGWIQIFKALNRSAPEVTDTAKKVAISRAINLLGKWMK